MKNLFLTMMVLFVGIHNALALDHQRNYNSPDYPIYENTFSTFNPVKGKAEPNPILKIVSYNIQFSKDIEKVVFELSKNPQLKKARIILLQEVVGIPGQSRGHAAEEIAKKLGMNYAYAPAFIHQKNELDFGVAILSYYPLKDISKVILPHLHYGQKTQRIALGATLHVGGQDLRIYSTHLETLQKNSQRIDQMNAIITDSKLHPTDHFVIGGDLNTIPFWQRFKLISFMKGIGFTDATKGIGETMRKVLGIIRVKLDHIFTKGMWVIGRGKSPFTNASDHRAIWIVTRFRHNHLLDI